MVPEARQTTYDAIERGALAAGEVAGRLLISEEDALAYVRARRERSEVRRALARAVDPFAIAAAVRGPVLL